jgi:hypothetical protein
MASGQGGGTTVGVPVPRPDAYEVWLYPESPSGGPQEPVLLGRYAAEGVELSVELPPGLSSFSAVHPVPVRRWATDWMVVGPFPNPQRVGTEYSPALDSAYGPEDDPDLGRTFTAVDGTEVGWNPAVGDSTGYVRLNPHFTPDDWVVAYAQAFLHSPDARDVVLLLGADDAHELWVNGRSFSSRQGRNISVVDDMEVLVPVQAGWNRVLLKVADLDGGWAFHLRVADPDGVLRWSRRPGG